MYDIESILMALFGGGYGDWNDIANTEYNWEDIFEELKIKFGDLEGVDINDIYTIIMEKGKWDFIKMVNDFIIENKNTEDKDLKQAIEKLKDFDFDNDEIWFIYANCLDSHIYLKVEDTEIIDILNNYLEDEIDDINDKIGFTYINIQER